MSSAAQQRPGNTAPSLNYDMAIPDKWTSTAYANAQRVLVDVLVPHIMNCLCGRPAFGEISLLQQKGLKFNVFQPQDPVVIKKLEMGIKMLTPPETGKNSFKVICGVKGRYAFAIWIVLLSGGYNEALALFSYMCEGPLKEEDKKKDKQLPPPSSPSPVIALLPPAEEPVPSVQLSEEELLAKYPDSLMHPLFLAHLQQKANAGKGFADPISKIEIAHLRMEFFQEYMSDMITNPKSRGSIVGLFTNRAKVGGLLARHDKTEDWYITSDGAALIGLSQYAELSPELGRINTRSYEGARALALEQSPVAPPVRPAVVLPVETVTPSPKLEDQIQELRDTKARNTQTIEKLLAENEDIDPRIANLEAAIRRRDEESNQQKLKELEQEELGLRAQMEELAKKRQALTGTA